MANLKLVRYAAPRTKFHSHLYAHASAYSLKGDYLNPPPDLATAENYLNSIIPELKGMPKYKYANDVKVVLTEASVYYEEEQTVSGTKRKLIGYELLKEEVPHE